MKTCLPIVTFIFIGLLATAQEKFTYDKEGLTDYTVTELEGTSSELYAKALNWVKETYKNPDEVLKMSIENEKIRIEGLSSKFYCKNAMGAQMCSDGLYTVEVSFKDGRYKFDAITLDAISENGQRGPIPLNDGSGYFNKKGEVKKVFGSFVKDIESLFNGLNQSLTDYIQGGATEKKDDW